MSVAFPTTRPPNISLLAPRESSCRLYGFDVHSPWLTTFIPDHDHPMAECLLRVIPNEGALERHKESPNTQPDLL